MLARPANPTKKRQKTEGRTRLTPPAPDTTQTAPPAASVAAPSARRLKVVAPEAKKQQAEFALNLGQAMQKKGISQSDLAREIWGSTKDARGYSVARNRDRISAYLAGAGVPEPENLRKLAAALDVQVEDLISWDPGKPLTVRAAKAQADVNISMIGGRPEETHVRIDTVVRFETAVRLAQLIEEDHKRQSEN